MRNIFLTLSRISFVFVFASMIGFSMGALWNINPGVLVFRLTWLWPAVLIMSMAGLLALARDLK